MRSITQRSFGGPEVFELVDVARPAPGAGEVLVRVRASALNPVDSAVRRGTVPLLGQPPFVVGWDVSGVVEQAGDGADLAAGDEVFGMPLFPASAAGYAEYVVAPASQLARKPAQLDHVQAAALPLAALTAWQGLVTAAGLTKGQRVLIHRAAGGVGHLAVQIAKARGAEVIALASEPKHEFVRSLGADRVIDYRTTDFTAAVADLDVVLDSAVEGDRSLSVLRPGGTLVTILQHRDKELAVRVEAAGRRFAGIEVRPDRAGLEAVSALVADGRLRVEIAETFPLEEVAKAHAVLDAGQTVGKIVLTV